MNQIFESVSKVSLFAVLICCCFCDTAALPYQELAPRPGYVPVYIREGDTPLESINPKLAEAFHEIEASNLMLESDAAAPEMILMSANKDGVLMLVNDQLMDETKQPAVVGETQSPNEQESSADQEAEVAATVLETTKTAKESDIASFDVVKMDDLDTTEKSHKSVA